MCHAITQVISPILIFFRLFFYFNFAALFAWCGTGQCKQTTWKKLKNNNHVCDTPSFNNALNCVDADASKFTPLISARATLKEQPLQMSEMKTAVRQY